MLRKALGKVTSLLDLTLLFSNVGVNVPLSATFTDIEGTHHSVNTADAGLDYARLIVKGNTAAGGAAITIQLYDATAAIVLCTVTVNVTNQLNTGAWTRIKPWNADHTIQLRVIGDNAKAQTLYNAHAQFNTLSFTG
jgi:hypothetical protein